MCLLSELKKFYVCSYHVVTGTPTRISDILNVLLGSILFQKDVSLYLNFSFKNLKLSNGSFPTPKETTTAIKKKKKLMIFYSY